MHKIYTNNCSSSSRESDSDSEESKEEGRMIIIVQCTMAKDNGIHADMLTYDGNSTSKRHLSGVYFLQQRLVKSPGSMYNAMSN